MHHQACQPGDVCIRLVMAEPQAHGRPDGLSIRRAGPEDWAVLRELRLNALSESPSAFGSTYESERMLTDAEWRERLTRQGRVSLIAFLGDLPVGIAGGFVEDAGYAHVVSMWVLPAARGRGVGDALVDEVLRWARQQGVSEARLWVTRGNEVAERLYARHGFDRNGEVQPLPSNPCVDEIGMRMVLADSHPARTRPTTARMVVE
jgi:GNAT superfamily N-acetyltransferase